MMSNWTVNNIETSIQSCNMNTVRVYTLWRRPLVLEISHTAVLIHAMPLLGLA